MPQRPGGHAYLLIGASATRTERHQMSGAKRALSALSGAKTRPEPAPSGHQTGGCERRKECAEARKRRSASCSARLPADVSSCGMERVSTTTAPLELARWSRWLNPYL